MKKNILFITRNGLLEPLGQSQILSYLKLLSTDFSINIISFEKQIDLLDNNKLNKIKKICFDNQISWHIINYSDKFRFLGVFIGFIQLFLKSFKICKSKNIDLIHARSYFPAFVALFLKYTIKTPFIFDMRALWPEELVQSNRLVKGSFQWKIIKLLETKCLVQQCGNSVA